MTSKPVTKVYLAGGMKSGWQDRVIPLCPGVTFLDPRSWESPDPLVYTNRDLVAVRDADLVLAQMGGDNPSGFGMSVEVGFAYGLGKHIVFLDETGNDWRRDYFDMHRVMADAVVYDAVAAAREVNTLFTDYPHL